MARFLRAAASIILISGAAGTALIHHRWVPQAQHVPKAPRVVSTEENLPVVTTAPAEPQSYKLIAEATSYCLKGTTFSGRPVGPGSIAVDPRLIPLASHIYVPGYGWGVADDTGSAIKGRHVDVWLPPSGPKSCPKSMAWGVRYLTIRVIPPPSASSKVIVRLRRAAIDLQLASARAATRASHS